jgi:phenylacetate-CoA ligase
MDAPVSATAAVLAGFDPGPEIRRGVRGQEQHVARLRSATRDLSRFARMSRPAEARASLEARLAALRLSLWRSPFYCAALRRCGLSPRDLLTLDDLRHFPLLNRDTLADAFAGIPALPKKGAIPRLLVDRSSGSTGRPLTVLKEDYDTVHMWAVLRFWMRWLGRRLPARPRVALLCSLPHGVEYRTPLPALGGGTLVRISLARPDPAGRLGRFRPHVVFSDPAGLHWLAVQTHPPRPRLLLSSAMHLSPGLRGRVERTLGVPVLNYYSSSETGPLAWECLEAPGRFHVLLPDAWVESVDGELVVTRLRESVLPLVRYRTGDRGRVFSDTCRCGYRGFSIHGLAGRSACVFHTPAGRDVDAWQLAWVFQHEPLDGFRLRQEGPEEFRLETTGETGERLVPRLRATLVSLGWREPRIESRRVTRESLAVAKPEPFVRRI